MTDSPSSPVEWARWARLTAVDLELSAGEAHVLSVLAGHAGRQGSVFPSIAAIAAQVRRSVSQVHRLIAGLVRRGLVRSRQRGPGQTALRELVADARAFVQLNLFDTPAPPAAPCSRRPACVAADPLPAATPERRQTTREAVAAAAPAPPSPRMGASKPSHGCEGEVPEEEPTASRALPRASAYVHPVSLHPVLEEMRDVIGDRMPAGMSIDDEIVQDDIAMVLTRFDGADHVRAARAVAIGVRTGKRHPIARQLYWALERQAIEQARCEERQRRSSAAAGGRRGRRAARGTARDPEAQARQDAALDLMVAEVERRNAERAAA